jgi:CDP-diacylglycerol--glycerol-3-phosphate 3-phosphatidyltransferase
MRRWESNVDTVFWLAAIGTLVASHHAWFLPKWPWLALVLALEALTYIVSWVRFHKEPATHSLAAKFWSLLLFALLVECSLTGTGDIFWYPCLAGAILVRLEVIAILLILREWASDVPHFNATNGSTAE